MKRATPSPLDILIVKMEEEDERNDDGEIDDAMIHDGQKLPDNWGSEVPLSAKEDENEKILIEDDEMDDIIANLIYEY